jgi:hypothetical protein
MKMFVGETRRVITLPSLGIVIKLPRIYLLQLLKMERWWRNFAGSCEIRSSVRWFLVRGICCNWHEYRFWLKTKNPFLQPTYFSFFGLINIQRFGCACTMDWKNVWHQLYEITGRACSLDGHTFDRVENYVVEDGNIKLVDYGTEVSRVVVSEYGELIHRVFDPTYSWERRKREL